MTLEKYWEKQPKVLESSLEHAEIDFPKLVPFLQSFKCGSLARCISLWTKRTPSWVSGGGGGWGRGREVFYFTRWTLLQAAWFFCLALNRWETQQGRGQGVKLWTWLFLPDPNHRALCDTQLKATSGSLSARAPEKQQWEPADTVRGAQRALPGASVHATKPSQRRYLHFISIILKCSFAVST